MHPFIELIGKIQYAIGIYVIQRIWSALNPPPPKKKLVKCSLLLIFMKVVLTGVQQLFLSITKTLDAAKYVLAISASVNTF